MTTNEKARREAGKTGALDKEAVRTSADKEPADTIAANASTGNAADGRVLTDEQREAVEFAISMLQLTWGEDRRAEVLSTLLTAPRAAVPAGWKLVPIEPTEEMIDAARWEAKNWSDGFPNHDAGYRVMLDAAPAAPVAEPMPYFSGVSELIIRDVCEMEPANPDFSDTICIDVSDLQAIVKRHTESQPISGVAAIREVIHELCTYDPPGDPYNGKHIHPGWARRLENALAVAQEVVADGAAQDAYAISSMIKALQLIDSELTEYLEGMPADETSRKLRDVARDALKAESAAAPATVSATADERAAFEAWMRTGELDTTPTLEFDGRNYDDWDTQRAWRGWQARASQAAAPALAREPAYLEAMLAAIDEFELVGDNNLARDLSAEEKFAVSEFVIGFFENRSVTPADAGEAVAIGRVTGIRELRFGMREWTVFWERPDDLQVGMKLYAARTDGAQGSGGGAA
ncbi:MAG: hypothetical protein V4801_02580 [Burkholderia gladioli]